jgi:hypothetical protein
MAREIPIDGIAKYAKGNLSKLVRAVALEADAQLKLQSPSDLGTFKGAWQLEIKPLEASVSNNTEYGEKLATGAAGSGSKRVTRYDPKRVVTTWGSPGGGSSIQTGGPGWIQTIAKNLQPYAEAQARIIERSD